LEDDARWRATPQSVAAATDLPDRIPSSESPPGHLPSTGATGTIKPPQCSHRPDDKN